MVFFIFSFPSLLTTPFTSLQPHRGKQKYPLQTITPRRSPLSSVTSSPSHTRTSSACGAPPDRLFPRSSKRRRATVMRAKFQSSKATDLRSSPSSPPLSRNPYRETSSREEACVICDEDGGELLCCWGNGCNRCYHLSCIDPPLTRALPCVWHCPRCVYKKFSLGVHSMSKGVESIWDVREVEATNTKGMHRQKQYFVKYHGLAHVHNHWVPDTQLCPENLSFFFNFIAKDQVGAITPQSLESLLPSIHEKIKY